MRLILLALMFCEDRPPQAPPVVQTVPPQAPAVVVNLPVQPVYQPVPQTAPT